MRIKSPLPLLHPSRKRAVYIVLLIILLWLLAQVYTFFTVSPARLLTGVVLVEEQRQWVWCVSGHPDVPLSPTETYYSTGFWVDRQGLVATSWHKREGVKENCKDAEKSQFIDKLSDSIRARQQELKSLFDELQYYQRTHTAVDEGFHQVQGFAQQLQQESDSLARLMTILQAATSHPNARLVQQRRLTLYFRPSASESLQRLEAEVVDTMHCRTLSQATPTEAYVFNPTAFRGWRKRRLALGYLQVPALASDSSAYVPEVFEVTEVLDSASFPDVLCGAPIVDEAGHLWGRCTRVGHTPMGGYAFSPRAWLTAMRQWVSGWFMSEDSSMNPREMLYRHLVQDSLSFSGISRSDTTCFGVLRYADGASYQGTLSASLQAKTSDKQGFLRSGVGVYTDPSATVYSGDWQGDSLLFGRVSGMGGQEIYTGALDLQFRRTGEGFLTGRSLYVGRWHEGRREGFGISLVPGELVQVGIWRKGRFRGEHIVHHANRVYGIDISRYQHEQGKRRYPIRWEALRVVKLGQNGVEKVDESVYFKLSFCYIKASEGTTTENKYSTDDAFLARRSGLKVGHYHFFSPKGGAEQAAWFLEQADLRKGDLPPMLDVELNDAQIARMGGATRMIEEMVHWIRAVRARCGSIPVLYVSQSFAEKYLREVPLEVQECPLWIARYSEYRPYLRLAFWQLSDRSRIKGIVGDVDLNVFNGSHEQFDEFVKRHGIR